MLAKRVKAEEHLYPRSEGITFMVSASGPKTMLPSFFCESKRYCVNVHGDLDTLRSILQVVVVFRAASHRCDDGRTALF